MIKQLPLFVSLLLALNYAAEFDRKIDFKRCDKDTVCFVKQSCIKGNEDDAEAKKKLVELSFASSGSETLDDKLPSGKCDAAIQMRRFTEFQVLVVLQLDGIDATEMKIVQEGKEMLSCKKDGDPGRDSKFKTVDYEGGKNFENKITFCSLLVTTETNFNNIVGDKDKAPKFEFASESLEYVTEVQGDEVGNGFWSMMTSKVKCSNEIKFIDSSTEDILKNVDLTKEELECPSKLLFKDVNGKFTKADKAECKGRSWSVLTTLGSTTLGRTDKLEIACIVKPFCAACSDLTVFKCNPPDSCKDPEKNNDAATGCLAYKCKDNKWVKGGEDVISTSEGAVCKRKDTSEESAWYIQDKGVPELIPASGVTCREKYVCSKEDVKLGCSGECPPGKSAPTLDEVNSVFNCTNGGQLYQSDNNVHPTCDHSKGKWNGLAEGDHLYCEVKEKVEPKAEPQSGGGGVVGAIVGIMIAASVVVGGALGYFLWWKPKQARQASKATTSKKSKKSTESGTKKPSDSDPPEKAGSGKEGGVPTDVEKLKTEPVPSGTKTDGAAPATPAAPAAAAPPPPPVPAAPTPV